MRLVIFPILLLLCGTITVKAYEDQMLEDDDFAEFEQFDADEESTVTDFGDEEKEVPLHKSKPVSSKEEQFDTNGVDEPEDDMMVEDDDSEFEHFQDPEEFEGFQDSVPHSSELPKITINKVPIIIRPRWDAYWLEGILCCLLAAYALAFVIGRGKNTSIAVNFLKQHAPLLNENFTLVGEAGNSAVAESEEGRGWRREAEHCFTMWCSGRVCCEGMLLTLQLIKRQDLAHVLFNLVRPSPDTLLIRAELGKEECDPFVLCVAQKKVANKLVKDMQDLSVYCPERRAGDKYGLPASLSVMSECAEVAGALLDARVGAALARLAPRLQYLHVSDQYSPRQLEDTAPTKPPETERVLLLKISLGPDGSADEVRPLLQLTFYLLDKIKRLRLSKEALTKCEKRRQKVMEAWVRGAHAARQEQAAAKREERRKVEKERILAEDDPEKQRRWELKEQKRQQKRKTPKMKQLKVKAL